MNSETLRNAFGECKRLDTSRCLNSTPYELVDFAEFYVADYNDNEPVQILTEKGDALLTVINTNKQQICVVKTDKCLFTDEHKKCDCILFSSDKIYFVEIKSGKKRQEARTKAIAQLDATITLMKNNNIDLTARDLHAIICLKSAIPRIPIASASSKIALFNEKHHIIPKEGNSIEF